MLHTRDTTYSLYLLGDLAVNPIQNSETPSTMTLEQGRIKDDVVGFLSSECFSFSFSFFVGLKHIFCS